jgi:hypothetical protein
MVLYSNNSIELQVFNLYKYTINVEIMFWYLFLIKKGSHFHENLFNIFN